jgi:hypothetical protein
MLKLLLWWKRRQQKMDLALLWPVCLQECKTEDDAKAIFRFHMDIDPAYNRMTAREKDAYVEEL